MLCHSVFLGEPMILTARARLAALAGLAFPLSLARAAQAQTGSVMTIVVPFTPGGSTDILARLLGNKLGQSLSRNVIIENKAGAGGVIGTGQVAKAEPDGNTLLMAHIGTLAVNPALYPSLPYDPLKSFTFLSLLAKVHNVLVVPKDLPVNNLAEFIAYAKARPGELNYGTGGNGSAAHIATEAFAHEFGLKLQHTPYRGTAPAVQDLLGGRLHVMLSGAPVLLPLAQSGDLKALAVSGLTRLPIAPDVPTLAEAGNRPGFEVSQWYGLVAPAGLKPAIRDDLSARVQAALKEQDVIDNLNQQGVEVWTSSPDEFRSFVTTEMARWKKLVEVAHITM